MGHNTIKLDLAQCEVFNHLPPMKAGILIKAMMSYCTTGEVASWGVDVDLKPIFMSFRATLNEQIEAYEKKSKAQRENIMKRWHKDSIPSIPNIPNVPMVSMVSNKETESETETDKERVIPKEKEKEKGKGKEKCVRASLFVPPTLTQVKEYVEEKGLKMDAEHFYDHFTSNGWKVSGKAAMKDWKAAVRNWARNEPQYQQRTQHGTSVGERAYNMLHFEYENTPEKWKEEEKKMQELQKNF